MKQLQPNEVVATLTLWRDTGVRCLGMINTMQQFVVGLAEIVESTPTRIAVRISEVIKRLELAPEDPIHEAVFAPADLAAAWQNAMFANAKSNGMGEHFDEMLQLVVRGDVGSVTLYRVTRFHRADRGEIAG